MIDVAVQADGWPEHDWQALAERASTQALTATPYALLLTSPAPIEIAIRLTSDAEVQVLNRDYRGKDAPTNVLSFPMLEREELADMPTDRETLLGDIILAYETCAREAAAKNISLEAHATHLIVHGTLHLLGYDHMEDAQALDMEMRERAAMAALGLHDPYDDEDD